jgi:pyruvate dehydrogenase phosphatase
MHYRLLPGLTPVVRSGLLTRSLNQRLGRHVPLRYFSQTHQPKHNVSNTFARSKAVMLSACAAALAGGAYYYWHHTSQRTPDKEVTVRGRHGTTVTFKLLSDEQVAQRLRARQGSIELPYHPVVRRTEWTQVPSNDPCEDYWCQHSLKDGTGFLFGVFDGHAGGACAQWLSKELPKRVADALATVPADAPVTARQKAIEDAFASTDDIIIHGSLERLKKLSELPPDVEADQAQVEDARRWLDRALNGSCAVMAYVDTIHREVLVALTGDSRVVLGQQSKTGQWKAKALSEDQVASNKSERERMMREHPNEPDLLKNDRVLGGLQPLRAFGDARYKWPVEIYEQVFETYPQRRGSPRNYLTPPYVTARPVVTVHKIEPQDRFMVIASDGLYDELTNDEIVQVVAGYLDEKARTKQWTYVEENAATGLVRNALGGKDQLKTAQLLSIPAPVSRRYRDDITVLVVHFGDEHQGRMWNEALKQQTPSGAPPSA